MASISDFLVSFESSNVSRLKVDSAFFSSTCDVDIPAIDTTTPMGQQAYMTRDQAYMFNSQVNSFLCSCPLYLDNGNVHALVFLGMTERIGKGICMD